MNNRSGDMQIVVLFLFGLFVIFRIYSLLWVAKDIAWRTSHVGMQLLSIACIVLLTPLIGLPVYFLLRPIQRKDLLIAQQEIGNRVQTQTITCQACGEANMHEHMFCAFCGQKLKQECKVCKGWYALGYLYCPYCVSPTKENDA